MERFTQRSTQPDKHWCVPLVDLIETGKVPSDGQYVPGCVIDRLADYEDAEEDKRLIILPKNYDEICDQRGDFIYGIIDGETIELLVTDIFIDKSHTLMIDCYCMDVKWVIEGGEPTEKDDPTAYAIPISEIGRTVFLTREEAEVALADMEEKS